MTLLSHDASVQQECCAVLSPFPPPSLPPLPPLLPVCVSVSLPATLCLSERACVCTSTDIARRALYYKLFDQLSFGVCVKCISPKP
jgi:hypothetical protein